MDFPAYLKHFDIHSCSKDCGNLKFREKSKVVRIGEHFLGIVKNQLFYFFKQLIIIIIGRN